MSAFVVEHELLLISTNICTIVHLCPQEMNDTSLLHIDIGDCRSYTPRQNSRIQCAHENSNPNHVHCSAEWMHSGWNAAIWPPLLDSSAMTTKIPLKTISIVTRTLRWSKVTVHHRNKTRRIPPKALKRPYLIVVRWMLGDIGPTCTANASEHRLACSANTWRRHRRVRRQDLQGLWRQTPTYLEASMSMCLCIIKVSDWKYKIFKTS